MKTQSFAVLFLAALSVSLGLLVASAGAGQRFQDGPAETRIHQRCADNVGRVGHVNNWPHAVVVRGSYAYAGVERRVMVLDVSDPADPRLVGQTGVLPTVVQDIAMAGQYAYVAAGDAGLRIVDASNPSAPVEAGAYAASDGANDVYVAGRYAYLATGAGLRVVDVIYPTAPLEVASYGTSGDARQIDVAGSYAYLLVSRGSRWQQHDVPGADVALLTTPAPAPSATPSPNDSLWVIDVSDPATPARAGAYDRLYDATAIQVAGRPSTGSGQRHAYVSTAGYIEGLRVIDVSDVTQLHEVGAYGQPGGLQDLYIVDNIAYVTTRTGVYTVDVSDPSQPVEVGAYARWWFAQAIHVVNNYAYLADSRLGLRVVDVSDPRRPQEIGGYAAPDVIQSVDVTGGYAYIAASSHGLQVVDVSNPRAPVEMGVYDTPGNALDVYLADGYAYVAAGAAGLRIIDVSTPDTPFEVGAFDTPGTAQGVHVAGGYAYVAAGAAGLHVIDVSDPAAPQAVANYQTRGPARDVDVAGRPSIDSGRRDATPTSRARPDCT